MSIMNQDNPYAMNQTCKVCGEPAAGFHFGAFTCEGCKSFFGRSYNNLSSISDCKNNGECIINKKNRTACKACRLRKCLMVGMSKSGSRYGRRSNWFKIHCLLQEQQQQAAAAMAAHQQHQAAGNAMSGVTSKPVGGVPPPTSAAAAAALGMLSHAAVSAYPRLYAGPRSKDELIMLGLEDYVVGAKHPAASPSVSSPDSHNSDSSAEVNMHGNPLLHLGGGRSVPTSAASGAVSEANVQSTTLGPQLRKDLPPFLPLPFPGLNSMPVMPPPPFLPASHLLFSGYHPALYPHHQALLKPTSEQQQAAAAAAAVQHLFNSSSVGGFGPTLPNAPTTPFVNKLALEKDERTPTQSPKNDNIHNNNNNNNNNNSNNNNHIPNGSKSAQEATKRFYLNAVFKSQQPSPPPTATKLNAHSKHDHSISALVTPNSESGRERPNSHQSNVEIDEVQDSNEVAKVEQDSNADSDCGEDLVVSMTPPCSPAQAKCKPTEHSQDNPIDLSMKTGGSVSSSISSKCSSSGSIHAGESDNELNDDNDNEAEGYETELEVAERIDEEEDSTTETVKTTIEQSKLNYKIINNNNNNNNNNSINTSDTNEQLAVGLNNFKRKPDEYADAEESVANDKRMKLTMEAATIESPAAVKVNTVVLDLTSKV